MSLTSFILRFAAPLPRIESFERFLFIGPHPDDIEIGAGATAAKLAEMGKRVTFLICLDGRFGFDHIDGVTPDELAAIRKDESIKAAAVLGIKDVRFLELSDGGLYDVNVLEQEMARVIGDVDPEVIFAPDPCVSSECHKDHLNVGEIARRLAFFAPFKDIMAHYEAKTADVKAIAYYMTAKPTRFVGTRKYLSRQSQAILCHKSQYPKGCDDLKAICTYLKLRSIDFGLRSFKGRAEGFRVLGRTHMHCLPEAGK